MINDENNYFICGLPYQFSIGGGLLSAEQMTNEMTEDDFNEIGWQMELKCLWFGSSQSCYFYFEDLDKVRTIREPLYPPQFYALLSTNRNRYRPKETGKSAL